MAEIKQLKKDMLSFETRQQYKAAAFYRDKLIQPIDTEL
jgi:hypothetical protein